MAATSTGRAAVPILFYFFILPGFDDVLAGWPEDRLDLHQGIADGGMILAFATGACALMNAARHHHNHHQHQ